MAEIIDNAPPAKRAKPAPLADEKAPRPRNVLLAEFEGLAKADASQALGQQVDVTCVNRRAGNYSSSGIATPNFFLESFSTRHNHFAKIHFNFSKKSVIFRKMFCYLAIIWDFAQC